MTGKRKDWNIAMTRTYINTKSVQAPYSSTSQFSNANPKYPTDTTGGPNGLIQDNKGGTYHEYEIIQRRLRNMSRPPCSNSKNYPSTNDPNRFSGVRRTYNPEHDLNDPYDP